MASPVLKKEVFFKGEGGEPEEKEKARVRKAVIRAFLKLRVSGFYHTGDTTIRRRGTEAGALNEPVDGNCFSCVCSRDNRNHPAP